MNGSEKKKKIVIGINGKYLSVSFAGRYKGVYETQGFCQLLQSLTLFLSLSLCPFAVLYTDIYNYIHIYTHIFIYVNAYYTYLVSNRAYDNWPRPTGPLIRERPKRDLWPPTGQWETFLIIFHSAKLSYKPVRHTALTHNPFDLLLLRT